VVLATGLLFAVPVAFGGFIGLALGDFVMVRPSRQLRLVGYVIVFISLAVLAPWILGVTAD
jgi:hypothetical protein